MSEYARLIIAVDSLQARLAERDLRDLQSQSSRTESAAVGMAKKIAAAFAGFKVAEQAKGAIFLASRYEQMGLVLRTVGENTGRSVADLAALELALQDTGISALESRNNIIKMMSANIDLSKATDLARLAQNAGVIANINSSEAFARLIKGIQSAEKETLETMGLNVNFAQSYEKLAAQLGKTSAQLTTTEKVQAGVNAAMEAGENIAGSYEASMENALKKLGSTSRVVEDIVRGLGEGALPAFGAGVDAYADSLGYLKENIEGLAQVIETSLYVALGVGAIAIAKKTAATVVGIQTSLAARAANIALAQSVVQSAIANQRAAQTAVHRAAMEAAAARGTAVQTAMSIQLAQARAAEAAATARVAASQVGLRAASAGMLGIIGGPIGLIAMVGLAALSFVDLGDKAQDGMGRAANATEQGATRIRNAIRSMLPDDIGSLSYSDIEREIEQLEGKLISATSNLERMQEAIDEGRASTGNTFFVDYREQVEALQGALAKLKSERDGDRFSSDLAGQQWLSNLQKQADFAGQLTELQKVNIAIEKGYAGTLSETDQKIARSNAALIDRASAVKANSKAVSTLAEDYKSFASGLERQKALYGETTEAARVDYELKNGSLQGIVGKQATYLLGLAAELDTKRDLTEQEQLRIDILRESGQLRAANDAQFQLEYAAKIAEYERQIVEYGKEGNIDAAQRSAEAVKQLETLRAIREVNMNAEQDPTAVEGVSKAPGSDGPDALYGGAAGELAKLEAERVLLDQWRATELEKQRGYLEVKEGFEKEYALRVENIHQQHQDRMAQLESSKNDVILSSSADFFGNMATLSQSGNKELGAIGKAAAIAQATISGFTAVQNALAVPPYPLGLALAASAGVVAAANVANIAGISFEGGGYTGNGPRAGGLDGKGGFMAMVHPKETIIDHTKSAANGGGGNSASGGTVVNLIEDASKAGQTQTRQMDGKQVMDVFVSNIMSDGQASKAIKRRFGLKDAAR